MVLKRNSISLSDLSLFLISCIMILSMQPWFAWNKPYMAILQVVVILLRILILNREGVRTSIVKLYPCVMSLFVWYVWYGLKSSYMTSSEDIVTFFFSQFLMLLFVLMLSGKEKSKLLLIVSKLYSSILLISIIFYLLFIIGFSLPNSILYHHNTFYKPFINFYFFIIESGYESMDFFRFRSIFSEPGYVGMMCSLYLYINKYNIRKWYNLVMLTSLIISFSFAAYILLLCGWILHLLIFNKINFKKILCIICVAFIAMYVVEMYTAKGTSDGIVSTFVLNRLKYDSERGISGNNRNDKMFDTFYDKFKNSNDYLFGIGRGKYSLLFQGTANSSYKSYIVEYGIIGLMLWAFIFICINNAYPSKYALGMFILFSLSFMQRPYWGWPAQSYAYIAAASVFYLEYSERLR